LAGDARKPVLLWFRRDLRLDDNRALQAAAASDAAIIPVYIREPERRDTGALGAAQAWWLHHSLTALRESLRKRGSDLLLVSGEALPVLAALCERTGADTVLWNRRYDPAGVAVDGKIQNALCKDGAEVHAFSGQILHEPSQLRTKAGSPFRSYTPFRNAFEQSGEPPEPIDAPDHLSAPHKWPRTEALSDWKLLPGHPDWASAFPEMWTPGEAAARQRLEDFIGEALDGYDRGRDLPAEPATSMLSPHLALGEISPARIWHATRGLTGTVPASDVVSFRRELVWREFSYHQLFHFPALRTKNWNERYDVFPWHSDSALFSRWTRGQTGYPIIDAGMRQLWRHGWMHNRVRMIVASFLVKDLLIDWRKGETWFRDTLVDADAANNAANWQWVAGSGADASPFFRIFNPVLQGEKFDPDGLYVKTFVPELADLPDKYIHRPFEAPDAVLAKAGITLGKTYPHPVVDHGAARKDALAAHAAMKNKA
jgi:deoxyribodipyrimidine photo-lyase